MKRNRFAACLIVCCIPTLLQAQISRGGEPWKWSDKFFPGTIPFIHTEELDVNLLRSEDDVTDQFKEAPFRFGVEHEMLLSSDACGEWALFPEENLAIWRLGIHCPDAVSVSFLFTSFNIPKGGKLFAWSGDREQFIGSFDHNDNNENGVFATSLIYGQDAVIEYQVALDQDWGSITIGQVIHGYRPILRSHFSDLDRGPFGNSGACNINVNCPEGDPWQVENQSVALIVQGGSAHCTGVLVNNTLEDGTPYFLTANHCLGNPGTWVFYFNHENDDCSGTTGPIDDVISGSVLKASNEDSDFALLELNDIPPADWNVQYAGWDNSDLESAVSSATGIHHPSGDVKKICFEEDAPHHASADLTAVWWIDQWELGVTEGGSSGSPLFNQDHRIIGQLFGGAAFCTGSVNNGQFDYYGRFGVSWDNGNTASSRLKDWLDPENTGVTTLDGWPIGFISYNYDASITSISGIENTVCGSTGTAVIMLRNNGVENLLSAEINYQLNGGEINVLNWTGNLAEDAQEQVELPELILTDGTNDLVVFVSNPNDLPDENTNNDDVVISFFAITGDVYNLTVNIMTDEYPEETSWEITEGQNVIWSGNNFSGINQLTEINVCLAVGCYEFTIYDEYGDGLCCDFGDGYYLVINPLGEVIAQGAEFGSYESTEICVETAIDEKLVETGIWVYPNPADQMLQVKTKFEPGFQLDFTDCTGRIVWHSESTTPNIALPVHHFEPGMYHLKVTSGDVQLFTPVLISH